MLGTDTIIYYTNHHKSAKKSIIRYKIFYPILLVVSYLALLTIVTVCSIRHIIDIDWIRKDLLFYILFALFIGSIIILSLSLRRCMKYGNSICQFFLIARDGRKYVINALNYNFQQYIQGYYGIRIVHHNPQVFPLLIFTNYYSEACMVNEIIDRRILFELEQKEILLQFATPLIYIDKYKENKKTISFTYSVLRIRTASKQMKQSVVLQRDHYEYIEQLVIDKEQEVEERKGIMLTEEQYDHVYQLVASNSKPSEVLKRLSSWAKDHYNITVLDYFVDINAAGKCIFIILKSNYDLLQCGYPNDEASIKQAFKDYYFNLKGDYEDSFQIAVEDKSYVAFWNFESEYDSWIMNKSAAELQSMRNNVRYGLYQVYVGFESVHFFYVTEKNVEENCRNGIDEEIKEECQRIIEQYDKLQLLKHGIPCVFTSKQMLDEQYRGSMFHYAHDHA